LRGYSRYGKAGELSQLAAEVVGDALPAGQVLVEVGELIEGDARGERMDTELKPHTGDRIAVGQMLGGDLCAASLVVVAVQEQAVEQLVVIRQREAALTSGEGFWPVHREGGDVTERADLPVRHDRAVSVGGILEKEQTVFVRQLAQLVDRRGKAPEVGRHDRCRLVGDAFLDVCHRDVARLVAVGEYGDRTQVQQRCRSGEERVGGDDHLVAGLDVSGRVGRVDRRGPGAGEYRMAHAEVVLERVLQLGDNA